MLVTTYRHLRQRPAGIQDVIKPLRHLSGRTPRSRPGCAGVTGQAGAYGTPGSFARKADGLGVVADARHQGQCGRVGPLGWLTGWVHRDRSKAGAGHEPDGNQAGTRVELDMREMAMAGAPHL
jgi:hypothetical protein